LLAPAAGSAAAAAATAGSAAGVLLLRADVADFGLDDVSAHAPASSLASCVQLRFSLLIKTKVKITENEKNNEFVNED